MRLDVPGGGYKTQNSIRKSSADIPSSLAPIRMSDNDNFGSCFETCISPHMEMFEDASKCIDRFQSILNAWSMPVKALIERV